MMQRQYDVPARQSGTALVIALVILASITLLAISAVQNSVSEMRMAQNEEFDMNAFQTAQSVVDAVTNDPASRENINNPGDSKTVGVDNTLAPFTLGTDEFMWATVTNIGVVSVSGLPLNKAYSASLCAYLYRVQGNVNRRETGQGTATVTQGLLRIGASSTTTGCGTT